MPETLAKCIKSIVRKYEAGETHDEGAFDPDCETCRILKELRIAIGEQRADEE